MSDLTTPQGLQLPLKCSHVLSDVPPCVDQSHLRTCDINFGDGSIIRFIRPHQLQRTDHYSQERAHIKHLLKHFSIEVFSQNNFGRANGASELGVSIDHKGPKALPFFDTSDGIFCETVRSRGDVQSRHAQVQRFLSLCQKRNLLRPAYLIFRRPNSTNDCRNRAHGLHPCGKVLRTLGPIAIKPRVRSMQSEHAQRSAQRQYQHPMLVDFNFDFHNSPPAIPGGSKA